MWEIARHISDTERTSSEAESETKQIKLFEYLQRVGEREDLPKGRCRLVSHRGAWVSSDGKVIQMGMRIPLHVIGLDREKRLVDFAVARPPTSTGTKPLGGRPPAVAKTHHTKPKPTSKPAAKAGPPMHHKKDRKLKHCGEGETVSGLLGLIQLDLT